MNLRLPKSKRWIAPATRLLLFAAFLCAARYAVDATRDATLRVRILDAATGRATPVRVHLADANGLTPKVTGALTVSESALGIPKAAIPVMYGRNDHADGYLLQADGSFYVDGAFETALPPGEYTLTLSKGPEYVSRTLPLRLAAGQETARSYRMERWIDMPARGWYSADDHVHLRRSPADNANILRWLAAEDIHVGNLLQMGDFWQTYYSQYSFGSKGRYQEQDYVLSPGQEEPRTPEIGHTISLGGDAFARFAGDYYSFDRLFDRVHQLNGITGFAHQGVSFHGYRGMTMNILRGKVDFLEVMQFCVPEGPLAVDYYYQFLDMGYKLTALAGSDFPWCGLGPSWGRPQELPQIGNARFYTYTGKPFTFEAWLAAVKAGHTFTTTGPMLELTVDNHIPGDTVNVAPGSRVHISAKAYGQASQVPVRELEIVAHGDSVRKVSAGDPGQSNALLRLDLDLPAEHGLWIAARAKASDTQLAHTTPVYVTVNGGGFENPKTFAANLDHSRKYLQEVEEELRHPGTAVDNQAARHQKSLEREISETRAVLQKLESRSPQR